MNTYQFEKVQGGYWGNTKLGKVVSIMAVSETDARIAIQSRKDYWKRLKNGDHQTWIMLDSTPKSC